MTWNFVFFLNSVLLGIGLAMDAFSVSLANGFNDSKMKLPKMCGIAGTFAFFQFAMPMIGWICVHTIVEQFKVFEYFIPWIALILLGFIGGKMIFEFFKKDENEEENGTKKLGFWALMVQGVATSIDALSVGFTIADYTIPFALVCGIIIAVVTFAISISGLVLGKTFGTRFSNKAELLGGIILVGIGLEIFISGMINLYA